MPNKKDEVVELSRPEANAAGPVVATCEMCQFLYTGYKKAHSKQAKAEYGEGFLNHYVHYHHDVFGDI